MITKEMLKNVVERLNRITKREYRVESSYGGWKLVVRENEGYSDITYGYISKKELYYTILSIIRVLEKEKET